MSTLFRLTLLVVLSCLLSLVASCGGDDDDDHGADDGGQNAFQTCTETANVLADVDEVSALLGISASDLLDTVGGGFATTAGRFARSSPRPRRVKANSPRSA